MIRITPSTPVLVAVQPVDFRRQFDGLMAHCRQALSTDPMSGVLIVFINRSRTMIRVLAFEGNGCWLMTKRLSKGKFTGWPTAREPLSALSARALMRIVRSVNPLDQSMDHK